MQGHGEGSRRAWGALLNRAENVPVSAKDLLEEVIPKPSSPQEEVIVKGIADGFERYLIEKDSGSKKENKKTVKNGNGGRGETWGQYLIKEIKALGAQDVVFDERKDKKIKFSYPDRKGRLQNRLLYLNEVADFIQKQQAKKATTSVEVTSSHEKDSNIAQTPIPVTEVGVSKVTNPFLISGDFGKSDRGTDVNSEILQEDFYKNAIGVESLPESLHDTKFGLADVDEFETSAVLSGEKMYAEEDVAEVLENERKIGQIFGREKEEIRQDAEHDLKVRWFEKEAYDYPERSDEVWNRFIVANPIEALLYRDHNPGIRSALERKEAKRVSVAKQEAVHVSEEVPMTSKQGMMEIVAELEKQRVAKPKPQEQKFFDSRFETEFGITEEQISQIEGYEHLSEGQQKLVLENLGEYARDNGKGKISRIFEQVLGNSAGDGQKKKKYADVATVLIRQTAQFGPKVHENENRKLQVDFVDMVLSREYRKEHKDVLDRFNELAHKYAKTKVEDLEDGIGTHSKDESKFISFFKNTFSSSREKHDNYEALQKSYEESKRDLVRVFSESGMTEGEIALKLVQIDSKVHALRFLQTEGEAVSIIEENPDKSMWQKVSEKVFTKENMIYAGLGFAGRIVTATAMGVYAAPVVAGALGGIRSWNKTATELREKDRMARAGVRDTSGEALNVVDANRKIEIGEKNVGITQKLQDLVDKYNKEGNTEEEKNRILESIQARVQYTEDKLRLNRVNFGSDTERTANMTKLFEVLGQAKKFLVQENNPVIAEDATRSLIEIVEEYKKSIMTDDGSVAFKYGTQMYDKKGDVTNESARVQADLRVKMRAQLQFINDKINLRDVLYGGGEDACISAVNMSVAIAEAEVLLADAEMPREQRVMDRLEQYLIKREGLIQTRRRKKQIKTAAFGVLKAGGLAYAGSLVAELDVVKEAKQYWGEKFFGGASGVGGLLGENSPSPQGDEIPTKPKVGYGPDQAIESSKLGSTVQETQARGAIPESAPEIQKSAPYTIKAGDTLTKILKEQAPSIKELGNTQAQENAVANILRSLTPVEMDSIGLSSHNIGNIRVDDSIDVQKLNAIIAEKQSIIESAQNRFEDESVRSYTEASPRSGSQQIEISKDIDAPGASPKPDEVMNRDQGVEESPSEGRSASDIVLKQQAEDSSLRSEEAPPVEAQQKSPTPSEPTIQPGSSPENIIEVEGAPVKRIEANDHVPSKFPEEGVRIPKDLEGSDSVADGQAEGGLVKSNASTPESTLPDYVEGGGTALDTESNAPEAKSTPGVHSPQETFKNTYGTEIDPKKEDIYELTGRGGEKVMVSYGGKNFETRFDFAQEYVKKNPDATVIVEEEPRYGAFGQKLPPSYVEVRYVRGEGVTTIFSIQDDTLPASSEKGIDPATFTKKVTK